MICAFYCYDRLYPVILLAWGKGWLAGSLDPLGYFQPQGSKGPKYGVCRVSVLGIVIMVWVHTFYLGPWTLRERVYKVSTQNHSYDF